MSDAWIETFSGKRFHLLEPQPEDICIEDIAHALSNQCRYTGHVRVFYSVAEHSVRVSYMSPEHRLEGLLHDASEAYLSDLSRPVKQLTPVGPPYYAVEDGIMKAIASKFGFSWPMSEEVKKADNGMLLAEKEQLMTKLSWDTVTHVWDALGEPSKVTLSCWAPEQAKRAFMTRFEEVQSGR